jgi:hypothetical protein
MDPQLKKKLDSAKPSRTSKKRTYDQPLRVLERGADRSPEGHWSRGRRGSEASELFYSIHWGEAWQQFLERKSDGRFKYRTARDLAHALAVGVDAKIRRRRAGYLYSAIGPVSAADKKKRVPYVGDWEMLRAQTFLGEVKDDQLLFGTPQMKVIKEAMRKMHDLTEIAQAHAALLMPFLGRYDAWCRQIDGAYNHSILNEKGKYDERRAKPYVEFINNMREAMVSTIEASLRCYGIGKDEASVLVQIFVARMRDELGDAMPIILAGLSGVPPTINGKAAAGGVQPVNGQDKGEMAVSPMLKLINESFLAKSIRFKMPHADVHIDGVPDVEEQATPREHAKLRPAISDRKKIQ